MERFNLFGLQNKLNTLTANEKHQALREHITIYKEMVLSEKSSLSIPKLATLKKEESEILYVIMFMAEELNIKQSQVFQYLF